MTTTATPTPPTKTLVPSKALLRRHKAAMRIVGDCKSVAERYELLLAVVAPRDPRLRSRFPSERSRREGSASDD